MLVPFGKRTFRYSTYSYNHSIGVTLDLLSIYMFHRVYPGVFFLKKDFINLGERDSKRKHEWDGGGGRVKQNPC